MTQYAKERIVFDTPIGSHQGIQFQIAECYAQLQAAELMVEKAAKTFDHFHSPTISKRDRFEIGRLANLSKLLASEASWKSADTCMQVFGGFGFATEYGIERKWREARLYRTAPISTNLIYSYIGEKVLGLPRSY